MRRTQLGRASPLPGSAFNSLFEMQHRLEYAKYEPDVPSFNSLFEMHQRRPCKQVVAPGLSILYLRCHHANACLSHASNMAFNSLFEMLLLGRAAVGRKGAVELSILYLRCASAGRRGAGRDLSAIFQFSI